MTHSFAIGLRELAVGDILSFDRDLDRIDWLTRVSEPAQLNALTG